MHEVVVDLQPDSISESSSPKPVSDSYFFFLFGGHLAIGEQGKVVVLAIGTRGKEDANGRPKTWDEEHLKVHLIFTTR